MEQINMTTHRCCECGSTVYAGSPVKPAKRTINSSQSVALVCRDIASEPVEYFQLLSMNIRLGLIKRTTIAKGGGWSCAVNPREVVRAALLDDASAVVFVHNHPSNDTTPSPEDNRLTAQLKDAFSLMGIKVVDHVIVAESGFYSYAEHGTL